MWKKVIIYSHGLSDHAYLRCFLKFAAVGDGYEVLVVEKLVRLADMAQNIPGLVFFVIVRSKGCEELAVVNAQGNESIKFQ
jgi:hypothetical protein